MNKKIHEMLGVLLNTPNQYYKYEELASMLSVSSRSVRNYLQTISDYLADQQALPLLDISDRGICFQGTSEEAEKLLEASVDNTFYLYRLSPEERSRIIFLKLLLSDDYCTLSQLSEAFNAGRTTILKDMEQVRQLLEHYDLSLAPAMNRGYLLDICERRRRELLIHAILSTDFDTCLNSQTVNIYEKFIFEEYQLEEFISGTQKILLELEYTYGLNISDAYFNEILITVVLSCRRLAMEKAIVKRGLLKLDFQIPAVYQTAHDICEQLAARYGFTYTEGEILFLAKTLYNHHFYSDQSPDNSEQFQLHIALYNFLHKVSSDLQIPLYEDRQMLEQLEKHLRDIAQARADGIYFKNEYANQMRQEYQTYYEVVSGHISILENCLGYTCNDDDIAFILFYIVVSVEKYYKKEILPKVIVVCHTGIGTANFLAEQLKSNFNIQILTVTSNHKLAEILPIYDFDLIVSTIPLKEPDCRWLRVSPMLEDQDILALQKIFTRIKRQKRSSNIPSPSNAPSAARTPLAGDTMKLLSRQKIQILEHCSSWENAIWEAARPLLQSCSITEHYISAMVSSVRKNGAYFIYCPHVALAHAAPSDGVLDFGLSLARLDPPVVFGHPANDPVKFILSLATGENEPRMQLVLQLMDLLGREEVQETLCNFSSVTEIFNYITNLMEDYHEK